MCNNPPRGLSLPTDTSSKNEVRGKSWTYHMISGKEKKLKLHRVKKSHPSNKDHVHLLLCSLNPKKVTFHYLRMNRPATPPSCLKIQDTMKSFKAFWHISRAPCTFSNFWKMLPNSPSWRVSACPNTAIVLKTKKNVGFG